MVAVGWGVFEGWGIGMMAVGGWTVFGGGLVGIVVGTTAGLDWHALTSRASNIKQWTVVTDGFDTMPAGLALLLSQ
jgi:hypothetical protein